MFKPIELLPKNLGCPAFQNGRIFSEIACYLISQFGPHLLEASSGFKSIAAVFFLIKNIVKVDITHLQGKKM